ncbi:phenylacetate--CoA ligase family protein [Muricomes intestini]|jgi:phenylacetate-CoA ligase|uniref:Phenylacetate-coenzyme A ligase n=1 Tax=Muricomes intestini TaxID=1796634 RepID=A0A4R3K1T9_9FIRM|nr:phenylacetate--CoA ligase [Muricomes intestini]TCS75795.1 phenylacetate-CoA ligase [Muricomes intestini]HAX52153.1 phenylacetate--CoA ligase [Lachnospiraceae bacterium]HCR82486.1 phenylacetate--CoA ligase [Lachnospiraceae bacterium]
MIWAKEETLPRAEIEAIQLKRLKETVTYIYERVEPYRKKMDEAKVKPEDIQTLQDLRKLPFTYKADFRENYPDGLFAVDKEDIVRYHASSGTTGKPTVVGYTANDLDIWLNNVARIACMGGATAKDVAQISFGYGTFTGALGLHGGLEKIGASVIPMSSGNSGKQMMFLQDMGVTLLVATPSYALHLGESLRECGVDPARDLKTRIGLFGGEGMTEPMRDEMHKVWGEQFICTQNYGMSELCGPGVAGECTRLCGMHINEDWFIPEIIDPDTEEVLPSGSTGELVVTCLGKEALPLVRYRTGDLTRLMYEPCECGRTTVRMANLSGRVDDMLVIRGVNVFPGQIEEVLFKIEEIGPHYEILVERKNRLDVMTITVELIDDRLLDSYSRLGSLEQGIKAALKSQLGLATHIRLVAPNSLQRFEGKAKRVTDLRKDGL